MSPVAKSPVSKSPVAKSPVAKAVRSRSSLVSSSAGYSAAGYSAAVDKYIENKAPFAQAILRHVRELIHQAVPEVEETIKWSMPFFVYRGIILANISGFKQHCNVGLWGKEITAALREEGTVSGESMGSFGRIEDLKDLPSDAKLLDYFRCAAAAIDSGQRTKSIERPSRTTAERVAKPEQMVPAELAAALKKNQAAQKVFDGFAPSHRREYIDWIDQAKREATRLQRVTQTVGMLAEGKRRNWKYENC